jgi:hypothetical protein
MDEYLAQLYGTAGDESDEDMDKVAEAELFAKLAADEGIDLNQLSDEQIVELYNVTFQKEAEGEEEEEKKESPFPPKKKEEEKKAAAEAELMQTKEAQEKFAEADYMGRIMAHAYVQELNKIAGVKDMLRGAEAGGQLARAGTELAAKSGGKAAKAKALAMRAKARLAHKAGRAGKAISGAARRAYEATADKARRGAARVGEHVGEHKKKYIAGSLLAAGTAGGAAGKYASALDDLGAEHAVIKAAEAGWDLDEAAERVIDVFEQGLIPEKTKIASANTVEEATEIRGLELLEAAGYPVTWGEE